MSERLGESQVVIDGGGWTEGGVAPGGRGGPEGGGEGCCGGHRGIWWTEDGLLILRKPAPSFKCKCLVVLVPF